MIRLELPLLLLLTGLTWGATLQVSPDAGPFRTIQAAIENAKPGDSVVIRAGQYHEAVRVTGDGLKITAASGEQVFITGADPILAGEWVQEPGRPVWRHTPWVYHGPTHPNDELHRLIGRTEQVIADGRLLQQVEQPADLRPGTFCADTHAKALWVWLPDGSDPARHRLDASVRPVLMSITGHRNTITGLQFLYASNRAQEAALDIEGSENLVEHCDVAWTNGVGARLGGTHNIALAIVSRFNGQMGMSGSGTANRMENCTLNDNNVKGYSKGWEAGGIKVALSRNFAIRRCISIRNDGPGFWFDIDNRDELIERSYAAENNGPGIFVEISETATVRNNLCVRNGLKDEPGAWGHAGILLGEAMRCVVEHNICAGNRTGIEVRQQAIRSLAADPTRNRPEEKRYFSDQLIFRNNISAYNREWQFALVGDNTFFGARREVSEQDLELLDPGRRRWTSGRNVYYAPPGKGLILWGAKWLPKHQEYSDLESFAAAHHLEQGSIAADPLFVNWENGDFTLRPASPAKRLEAGFSEVPVIPAGHSQ